MAHKLILKVKKFQFFVAKRFGTVEEGLNHSSQITKPGLCEF